MRSEKKIKHAIGGLRKLPARAYTAGIAAGTALIGIALLSALPDSGRSLPDFREYAAGPERKAQFLAFARPLIQAENARLLEDRQRLKSLRAKPQLGWLDRRWLRSLAEDFRLPNDDLSDDAIVDALLRRVDTVPVSLALAQAAKESGWGTSRFAREGFNLFGERCFDPGCGIVPRARPQERSHEVRAFASPRHSVGSYFDNINTHRSYRAFRKVRADMRANEQQLSGLRLAEELSRYSERRSDYIAELKRLIIINDLANDPANPPADPPPDDPTNDPDARAGDSGG